jgi:hypothetical protein
MRNVYEIFVGKPKRKGALGRCRCSFEKNIRLGLREIVGEVVIGCKCLRSGLVAGRCEHGNEPSDSIKSGNSSD